MPERLSCRRTIQLCPESEAGNGTLRRLMMSSARPPPKSDATIANSAKLEKPSHNAMQANSLASPPPTWPSANKENPAASPPAPGARCRPTWPSVMPETATKSTKAAMSTSDSALGIVKLIRSQQAASASRATRSNTSASTIIANHPEETGGRLAARPPARKTQAALFHAARNGAERARQLGADGRHRADHDDGDERRDQTVFDGRGAGFVAHDTGNQISR